MSTTRWLAPDPDEERRLGPTSRQVGWAPPTIQPERMVGDAGDAHSTNAKATTTSWGQRCREAAAWAIPSVILALMPKCPACLAAYVALLTGLGLSYSAASYTRTLLLIVSIGSLLYLVLNLLGRFVVAKTYRTTKPA